MRTQGGLLRAVAVVGLLSAAFFAALPWLGCLASHPLGFFAFANDNFFMLRTCTVGLPYDFGPPRGLPGFNGPYWGNLTLGLAYLIAAVYVTLSKRL